MPKPNLPAWQLVSSRSLLAHPFIQLREDTVRLASGREVNWWRFADSGRDTVCIIALDTERRILVAYQYNHPPQRVVDEFPGGGVHADELYGDAARRELLEETGFYAHQITPIGAFLINNRRSAMRCRVFVATELELRVEAPDPEELIVYEWLTGEQIEARIRSGELENSFLLAAWSLFRAQQILNNS